MKRPPQFSNGNLTWGSAILLLAVILCRLFDALGFHFPAP